MECKSCWWQEGGKCYKDEKDIVPVPVAKCSCYWNKRAALGSVIPNDKLIITSDGGRGEIRLDTKSTISSSKKERINIRDEGSCTTFKV